MNNETTLRNDPLQIVLDNTPASVYVCDVDTYEIVFANKALKSLYPYEVEGMKCWKALSLYEGPCPYCKLHEVLKKPLGEPYFWENYNPHLNSWLQMNDSIVKWTDGRDVHLITVTDISEVKNNAEQLRIYKDELEKMLAEKTESEQKLQSMSDNMPNAFTFQLIERENNVPLLLYISKGVETICGIPVDQMGEDVMPIFNNMNPEDVMNFVKAASAGKPFTLETPYTKPGTGEKKWLEISEIPRMNTAGEIVWDGLAIDITLRKQVESELKQSQDLLLKADLVNEISNNMEKSAIYRTHQNAQGRTILDYVSNNIDQLSGGISASELQENIAPFFFNIYPEDRPILNEIRAGATEAGSISSVFRYIRDGELCWYKIQSKGSLQGDIVVHDGILMDITDQKRLENDLIQARNQAEESDRLKSTFMANMSHEIRTPMNAILGFLELIFSEEMELDPQTVKEFVRIITDNAHQLMKLINDLLDISKLDAGQVKIVPKKGELNTLMQDIHASFITSGVIAPEKKMELLVDTSGQDAVGEFTLDYFRLRQVLNNIIGNAIKFTDRGYIRFGYRPTPQGLHFFVEDTGIGISSEKIKDIYRPFHQVYDESKAAQYGGTGMGLAICKNLVELMGGVLLVNSEVGKGTCFEFIIPCVEILPKPPSSSK